ncbi:putative two-component histidine kinase [Gemmatimonas aurantiaca T-27]|uniref:histidine kinase n=2 Tax=Gemmatimonas aurantiaca TaxID=173480 RepID=C1A634_GEMAT|nr:putative two-component histidine kinase [Gemmatimonas aurantiaca T-27]
MLLLFALIPTVVVTLAWTGLAARTLSLLSARSAWERIAHSGEEALRAVDRAPLSPAQRQALERHEAELRESAQLARRFDFVAGRSMRLVLVGGLFVVVLVAIGASRVAGHLSRQLSRPLDELVGWTGLVRMGRPIPEQTDRRGAPEFEVLRSGMRTMAMELETGRRRALEAERAEAFRESARRFAHELKNPLTPIRFAVDRLRRQAPEELRDTVDVLAEEAARLETMARSFAQFGRLPDGPPAEIDVSELVTRVARAVVPERLTLDLSCGEELPLVVGFHESLVRAVTNILINAVDATPGAGTIQVAVYREPSMVAIRIGDSGTGMTPEVLQRIFEPYVTTKPGGTGLGLAIARQTIEAHRGTVVASSIVGHGTVMLVRLPIGTDTSGGPRSPMSNIGVGT